VVVEPGLIETAFGDTATDDVLKRSGSGAYAKLAQAVARVTKNAYGHGRDTDPSVIADIVSKAVKADEPRTRYVAGKYAKPMIMMRRWLGDRMFDHL
jgi:NAD(P)-dependent dehydrogenase (short-subunit alcohol dehydrogenase family)